MTHAISTPACTHTASDPYLIHLWDRGKSTGIHHRLMDGGMQPISSSLLALIDLGQAREGFATNTGFQFCPDCVAANEERARARAEKRALDRELQDLKAQRVDLAYEIAATLQHEPGRDISDLLDDLVRVDQQERDLLEQRKAKEAGK